MIWRVLQARAQRRARQARLQAAWAALPASAWLPEGPLTEQRWVVLDLETTGLDPRQDEVLSMGAVAIQGRDIVLSDRFEATLYVTDHQASASVVVHGITPEAVRRGEEAAEAWLRFLTWSNGAGLLAFHAAFDRAFMMRALQAHLGVTPELTWIDVADLAPCVLSERGHARLSLDDWLAATGCTVHQRHDALSDALATAELSVMALSAAAQQGVQTPAQLVARLQQWRQLQQLSGVR